MASHQSVNDEIVRFCALCAKDPWLWTKGAYPWNVSGSQIEGMRPHAWQEGDLKYLRDELNKEHDPEVPRVIRMGTSSGHGVGKSAEVSWLTGWALSTMPLSRVWITANTETQLRTKTGAEINKWHNMSITRDWFKSRPLSVVSQQEPVNWRADLQPWSEQRPESTAGLHNLGRRILIIMDEASAIPRIIWETIEGAMTDPGTEIIWVVYGNPTRNNGQFADIFKLQRHLWRTQHIDSRDVPGAVDMALIKQWEDLYGEDSDFFKVRVRGIFPSASSLQFIDEETVNEACVREACSTVMDAKVVGIDVARGGENDFVIRCRVGRDARTHKGMRIPGEQTRDTMRMATVVANYLSKEKPDACFIDGGGPGGPLCDRLHDLGFPVQEVVFGGRASEPRRFANKRAEIWWTMREWLMAGGAIPNEPQLRKDLCVLEADTDKTDRWLLESKESLRMRNEDSPDDGDALALTFTAPVVKAEVMGLRNRSQAFAADWSPTEGVPETPARMNISHEDPWGHN